MSVGGKLHDGQKAKVVEARIDHLLHVPFEGYAPDGSSPEPCRISDAVPVTRFFECLDLRIKTAKLTVADQHQLSARRIVADLGVAAEHRR